MFTAQFPVNYTFLKMTPVAGFFGKPAGKEIIGT